MISIIFPRPMLRNWKLGFTTNLSSKIKFIIRGKAKEIKMTNKRPITNPYFRVTSKVAKVVNSIPGMKFILPKMVFSKRTIKEANINTNPPKRRSTNKKIPRIMR